MSILPYRTHDDRIDGVVITFVDITAAKTLEAQLREKHSVLERHVTGQSAKMQRARNKVDCGNSRTQSNQEWC